MSTTWQAWDLGMRPTHLKSFPVRSFPGICNVICFICHHSRVYLLPCSYSLVISGWQAKSHPLVPHQWTLASSPRKSFLSQDVTDFSYPNFLYILDVTTLILQMLQLNEHIISHKVCFIMSFTIPYYPESEGCSKKNMDLDVLSCFSGFNHTIPSI